MGPEDDLFALPEWEMKSHGYGFDMQKALYEKYYGLPAAIPGTSHHETSKAIDFSQHYGMSANKMAEYLKANVAAMKKFHEVEVTYLFLGGPAHGQRYNTQGLWSWKIWEPQKVEFAKASDNEVPTLPMDKAHVYHRQEVSAGAGQTVTVYIHDSFAASDDQWISKLLVDVLGPKPEQKKPVVETAKEPWASIEWDAPQTEEETKEEVSDGLRITVGGKTFEWKLDDDQIHGILAWAENSLGEGKDI